MKTVYAMAARWLVAAVALCAGGARGYDATWPGCDTMKGTKALTVAKPGLTDNRVTGINFINCNFSTISIESLKIYPNVKVINLNDITVTDAAVHTLAFFTNLEQFAMKQTTILAKSLPSNFFRNNRRLHYIDFQNTEMTRAPADLLQGMTQLRTLFLVNCSFNENSLPKMYTNQVFPSMDFLQIFSNNIPELNDPNTFSNAASLTSLVLVNDNINTMHPDILRPLTNIRLIRFDFNKLRSIPGSLFQNRSALYDIKLSHNLIENIPLNAFLGCNNLIYLFLNDNRLMYLPGNFFPNLLATGVDLRHFDFFASSWECRCLIRILKTVKELRIDYDKHRFNGRDPACVIVSSVFNDHK